MFSFIHSLIQSFIHSLLHFFSRLLITLSIWSVHHLFISMSHHTLLYLFIYNFNLFGYLFISSFIVYMFNFPPFNNLSCHKYSICLFICLFIFPFIHSFSHLFITLVSLFTYLFMLIYFFIFSIFHHFFNYSLFLFISLLIVSFSQ